MATDSRAAPIEPPAGAEHVYEVLFAEVTRQLSDAENLDRKLSIAIAALIAVAGAIYAASPPAIIGAVISGWLLVALIQAIRGFYYDDKFGEGVNQRFLQERIGLGPAVIKWHSIVVLEAAQKGNRARLRRKGRLLSQVTVTIGLVAGVGLVGKMLGVS